MSDAYIDDCTITSANFEPQILFTGKDGEEIFKINNEGVFVYGERVESAEKDGSKIFEALEDFLNSYGLL